MDTEDKHARRGESSKCNVLPPSLPPRGLSRPEAAAYIGVSPGTFDKLVDDGRMPQAKRINARLVWDRHALDAAFADLPDNGEGRGGDNDGEEENPWDNRY